MMHVQNHIKHVLTTSKVHNLTNPIHIHTNTPVVQIIADLYEILTWHFSKTFFNLASVLYLLIFL